jgi:hypothetical protein
MTHPRDKHFPGTRICPTCWSVERSRIVRSPRNLLRILAKSVLWVVVGTDAWLFELQMQCDACGARYYPGSLTDESVCANCGYRLRGQDPAWCPECGRSYRCAVDESGRPTPIA